MTSEGDNSVSITGHKDKTLILHYGHASTESRDKAMDVLEQFAGKRILDSAWTRLMSIR